MEPNTPSAVAGPGAQQRVGDLERSAVCDELAAQFAAGRLSGDELEERLEAAMSARTRWDLRLLVRDLPRTGGDPASVAVVRVQPASWTPLDVLTLLLLVGSVFTVGVLMIGLGLVGSLEGVAVAAVGGLLAVAIGASLAHLIHRSWDRHAARLIA